MNTQKKTELRLLMNTNKYRKTPKGVLTNMNNHKKEKNKKNGFGEIGYTLKWLQDTYLNNPTFLKLFKEWEKSNYLKALKPSIDRINNKKGYTKDNIHILTWGENRFKQTMERRSRKGIVYQVLNNKVIKIWKSQREICKTLNISQSYLSNVLTGRKKTAYGYKWIYGNIYENKELLKS